MLGEITFNRCHRRDLATGSGEEWDESESIAIYLEVLLNHEGP